MELGAKINLLPYVAFGGLFYHSNRKGANPKYKAEEYRAPPDGMAVAAVKIMEALSRAAGEPAGTSVRAGCRNTGRSINAFSREEAGGGCGSRVPETSGKLSSLTKTKIPGS